MASAKKGAEGAEGGVGFEEGCPLPTGGGLSGGGYAPSSEIISILSLKWQVLVHSGS